MNDLIRSAKTIDVLGFGIAAVDDILDLPSYPVSGSKMPIARLCRHAGGQCTTALAAAARLGLQCTYGGVLGQDELSNFTREMLAREGIRVGEVRPHPQARPYHSFILVDAASGERTILYSGEAVYGPEPEDIDSELIAASRVLLVDQIGPAGTLHACQIARNLGVPIVADLERMDSDPLRQIMDLSDHLILSAHIAAQITGQSDPAQALPKLAVRTRPCTAITDGAKGCWFIAGETSSLIQHQPAFKCKAIDTTGCGDVFHGAYAAGLVLGQPVAQAIRFASATAALKATRGGGQTGIPSRDMVNAFLQDMD